MTASPVFLASSDPKRLTAARNALLAAADQLLGAMGSIEAFDTERLSVALGDSLGVEVLLAPLTGAQVSITHVLASGIRKVVVAVPVPNPSAH